MGWQRVRVGPTVAALGLCAGILAPLAAPAVRAATPATWLAGAAAETLTPPAYNPADDARDFPGCDTSIYNGKRLFDLEEPYIDRAGTGFFDYNQDPYCDANHNGRYDGLYNSGGVDHLLEWVHDRIWARALAISDGPTTIVIESITSQGLGIEDVTRIRQQVNQDLQGKHRPHVAQVFVSSTHNESSPDPIGIYGAPADPTGAVGLHSGIDDYYISYLVQQSARAAEAAVGAMVHARMRVADFYPADVRARLSDTFLTTDAIKTPPPGAPPFGTPEATDTRGRVVQLQDAVTGANIETVFNWSAHNQETGHAPDSSQVSVGGVMKRVNRAVSDDWPGVFASRLEASLGGHAMFLVADNGSIEDPHAYPLPSPDNECPASDFTDGQARSEGCFNLPAYTGAHLATNVRGVVQGGMDEVVRHSLTQRTSQFSVPLQNQLFVAAFAAGIFAHRTPATLSACADSEGVPRTCLLTEVGLADFGPELQMLVNPGEAYPALIEGHPFGVEQISCPERAAPPVPAWHASAAYKLEMGLGDDMLGYEIPAPGWFADPAVYADPLCPAGAQAMQDPSADYDQHNQYHKLESESVGPDTGNAIATQLATLARSVSRGPETAQILPGRFLRPDGSFSRKGADSPVGMWVLPAGSTVFAPGTGTVVALSGITNFGSTPVNATGVFMDFDGRAQAGPDIDTRGMQVQNADGSVTRYYMDPYPQLGGRQPGAAAGPAITAPGSAPGLRIPGELPLTSAPLALPFALGLLLLGGTLFEVSRRAVGRSRR